MFLFLLLASLLAFTGAASAARIVIAKPIRFQLPLIARIGSPYSWSISPSTFIIEDDQGYTSGAPNYATTGLPQWLKFSTSTLSFTGTVPTSALPGTVHITVTASASSADNSSSDSFDLLISSNPPPRLDIPLTQQFYDGNPAISGAFMVNPSSALAPYYSTTTPREGGSVVGLRIPPTWEFSIGLQGATFSPWPLSYSASLVAGTPLPSWIKYNQRSFTFDGIAPDYENGRLPDPMEVLIEASDAEGYSAGPTARQTFWLTVASHELKIKDGSRGIERNVSVGSGFVLDLMDGPDENPWMGEVFWDAKFLPRDGIQKVSVNPPEGTTFLYDPNSSRISGNIAASKIGQKLHGVPLVITDMQNVSLNTLLVLSPIPSFFILPPSEDPSSNAGVAPFAPGEVPVPQNFLSPVTFDLSKYMALDGPALIKSGAVQISASIAPEAAKTWLSFDAAALMLKGTVPANGERVDEHFTTRSSYSMAKASGATSATRERRKNHHARQSPTDQMFAVAPTSVSSNQITAANSSHLVSAPSLAPVVQLASSSANLTMVNVTFSAHSLDSRTISTMNVVLQLGVNMTCTSTTCSSNTNDDPSQSSRAARVGLILALVFGSILLLFFIVACYRMRKKRTSTQLRVESTDIAKDESYIPQRDLTSGDVVTGNDRWAHHSVAYDGTDLEKGGGGKSARVHSAAEARNVAAAMPRRGSDSGSESRAATPTAVHHTNVAIEAKNMVGPEDPGATSETSGSRYEDGTSIGTGYGARAHGRGGSTSGSGTDKEAVTSGESDMDTGHLAPPSKAYTRPGPSSRTVSPAPSSATAASGATLPKQKFFAKLKNFGQRPRDDPTSQSSSGEEELPPKVPSKTSLLSSVPAVTKPSVLANIMPAIKQSSLGSLFGLNNGEAGSVASKNSSRSRGKPDNAKLDISKPRPLMPSLGAYLAKDYAEQVARAAASGGITSRQPSDDGGAGFVAGNVVIYSMENHPLPLTRPSTPIHEQSLAQPVFPAFVWPTQMQPESGNMPPKSFYPAAQTSQKSIRMVIPAQSKPSSRTDVPAFLRKRSKEADIPQTTSHDDSFSSSSETSTLGGDGFAEELVTGTTAPREVPHRRFDFGRPRGSMTDSDVPISITNTLLANTSVQHSKVGSQESIASVAVFGTAALAVRSPLAPVKLLPSPKPSLSSTFDPSPTNRQNSPKASIHASPKTVPSAPTAQARLVQFVHEKQYDGGSSSEGASSDDPVPGAYSAYQGKREISHKAVIEGFELGPSEKWENLPPAPSTLPVHVTGSSSRLADKVRMLREQSRLYHEQQVKEGASSPLASSTRRAPSPTDDGLLNDPALALGLQYMKSFGSDGSLSSERGQSTTPCPRIPSPEAGMGIAMGGEGNSSTGSVAGRAKVINPGSIASRSRPRASQLQASFIAYDNESHSSDSDRRSPPRIPLPATPATETQYFDLSESSSGSTSSSTGSNVVVHRAGQERILVGVNEPFNFPSPLALPGFSPGQSSRMRITRMVKAAHQLRQQQQESDSSKSSDSDGAGNNVKLWAESENRGKLPEWLGFDPLEAEFWGVPVPGVRGNSVRVKVYFRDGNEVTEVGRFIVEVVGR